ncbi:hypothetical protein CRG98_020780 [Punica granatum]|uniref:Major facilitator superfamily (MFS) profile domain-containing protein n=1 Tax=Punica granatum TaxID=22663 RepID=A0A2I0JSC8_PUNGR|nr:hypothetical protein CRG98_020780 [Punica granatum]
MAEQKMVVEDNWTNTAAGDVDGTPKKPPRKNKFAFACGILASMNSILLGYDVGVMSGANEYIKKDLGFSDVQIEILAGIINFYALIGSALAGRTSDLVGRRYTIVIAGAVFFAGALFMGFAMNFWFLMFGRFVAGIGMGYALMIAPVYTAEVAPASARGFLTSFPEVFINSGVLLGYVSNYAFSKLPLNLGWRFMLGLGAIPSIVLALGVLAMPESPRWLVLQGRLGEAKQVLYKTSDTKEEAELRLADIKEAAGIPLDCNEDRVQISKKKSSGSGVWRELFLHPTPAVRHVLIAAVGIHFFQQATGIDTVVLYSPRIFEKAGITSSDKKLLATVAVGFSKTICILVSTFYLDRLGRRPILLASVAGMIVSLVTLASVLAVVNSHPNEKLMWAIILCFIMVLTFVGSFSMGQGPIAWVYSSEIFPLRLRAQGSGICVAAITISGSFFLFASFAAISWVFFYTMLPETRGRTLEEMEVLFGSYHRWRSVAKKLEKNEIRVVTDRDKICNNEIQLPVTGQAEKAGT